MRVAVIVAAGGAGKRLDRKVPKPFISILGKPLLVYTLESLRKSFRFLEWVLVVAPSRVKRARRLVRRHGFDSVRIAEGGKTRAESVWKGLVHVNRSCEWVLIHDAARPFVPKGSVRRLLRAVRETGAVISALPCEDTLKKACPGSLVVSKTEDRGLFYRAQTPQVFKRELLVRRYRELGRSAFQATDEAALFDGTGVKVKIVLGDPANIKITTPADLEFFRFCLKRKNRG